MNVYTAFWKAIWSRPIEAFGALYWHLTGRKVRARNRLRLCLAQGPQAYSDWIDTIEQQQRVVAQAAATMATWRARPHFSIVYHLTADQNASQIDTLIATMHSQVYSHWEVVIVRAPDAMAIDIDDKAGFRVADMQADRPSEALRIGAWQAEGQYLLPLPKGASLPPTALFRYAELLEIHPAAILLYGDNDWIGADGERVRPWLKPQWNEDLALAQDYLSQAFVIERETARHAMRHNMTGGAEVPYALTLAVASSRPDDIVHVPHIQSHLMDTDVAANQEDRRRLVQAHLDATVDGAVASIGPYGTIRVDWPLPEPHPLVSIIIPTRDKVSLLRACIDSLLAQTSYAAFEILVVDNGSRQPSALAYLRRIGDHSRVHVLRDDRSYNFSQLNNMAVHHARGDYLCLLNNDTEIIDGDWLTAMMRQAARPAVGAVGARLLYGDRSIQHAGVVIGLGDAAGHAHRFSASDNVGYFGRTHVAHRLSAVTAACLVVSKAKFLAVGGLDEVDLRIAFNDVDLCLKLQAAGWQNIYTPDATLLHHESKSRGKDSSPAHIDRYRQELRTLQKRWNTRGYLDPLHHVSLDRSVEPYLLRLEIDSGTRG